MPNRLQIIFNIQIFKLFYALPNISFILYFWLGKFARLASMKEPWFCKHPKRGLNFLAISIVFSLASLFAVFTAKGNYGMHNLKLERQSVTLL